MSFGAAWLRGLGLSLEPGPRAGSAGGRLAVLLIAFAAVLPSAAHVQPVPGEAIEQYRSNLINDIDQALAGARELRDRLAACDIPGAQKAWVSARVGWERSEVFTTGFVPDLDYAIDAWPDAARGFHGIEARLFGANPAGAEEEADALIRHLAELKEEIHRIELTPQGLLNGLTRLAYEVGDSKVDGGESRLSGTSLNDMRNNDDGIELAYRVLFANILEAGAPKLAERVRGEIDRLKALLTVRDLKNIDSEKLRKASEALVVTLQSAGPKMGLATPTLEEAAR